MFGNSSGKIAADPLRGLARRATLTRFSSEHRLWLLLCHSQLQHSTARWHTDEDMEPPRCSFLALGVAPSIPTIWLTKQPHFLEHQSQTRDHICPPHPPNSLLFPSQRLVEHFYSTRVSPSSSSISVSFGLYPLLAASLPFILVLPSLSFFLPPHSPSLSARQPSFQYLLP